MKNSILSALLLCFGFLIINPAFAQELTAQQAWKQLVGERNFKRKAKAFEYVANDPSLPNVLIYGDSISLGYTPIVRRQLLKKANVYRLHCNGGHSASFISKMDLMMQTMTDSKLKDPWTFKWNIIIFNVGLHDLKYLDGKKLDTEKGTQVNTPKVYSQNLQKIITYLQETQPQARLGYVLTTPVPKDSKGRKAGDAVIYNQAAMEVLKSYPNVKVADMYALIFPNHDKWMQSPGNVHYNTKGIKQQGHFITGIIHSMLVVK